jgi:hypothetical protein
MRALLAIAVLAAAPVPAQNVAQAPARPPTLAPARVVHEWPTEEARQGAAADARYVYAVNNNQIGKYDKATGRRVARFEGERRLFPHMNSCLVDGAELICAGSNYPAVPQASVIEIFDTATLHHRRSIALAPFPGSLTWIERRGTTWFAMFANYPADRGGEGGRDYRWTTLVELDASFRALRSWHLPESILSRLAPMSVSGGSWGADGLLYITGHDAPELYVLRLPTAGTVLEHVATVPLPTEGQAFAWDRSRRRTIVTITRKDRRIVASVVPDVAVER